MTPMLALVTLLQFLLGLGMQAQMAVNIPRTLSLPIAFIVGMFVHTVLLLLADIAGIGITVASVVGTALIGVAGTHARWGSCKAYYRLLFAKPSFTLRMYDIVTLGVACYLGFMVLWAAWYWPVTPFDAMAGIDLVARQTAMEGTVNNRVFTDVSLSGLLSNQPFYAPFTMMMQTIGHVCGVEHGHVWVGFVSVVFSWFVWGVLRQYAHPFIAGLAFILFVLTPEMFGYAYLLQTDYLNAVCMATGVIFLWRGIDMHDDKQVLLASVLLAGGCWSRTETIAIVGVGGALTLPFMARVFGWKRTIRLGAIAGVMSAVAFALWHIVMFQFVLPVHPDTTSQLVALGADGLTSVIERSFANVILETDLWGLAYVVFVLAFVGSALWKKSVEPLVLLVWIVAIHLTLWIVSATFSAAIVEQTLRRGIFKVIPLLFVYAVASPFMKMMSDRLSQWEGNTTT